MAQGDVTWFEETWEKIHEDINLETDSFKMAILDSGATPSASASGPAYSGGTTNYSTDEIAGTGGYTTGGNACANPALTEAGGALTFDTDDPATWTKNASSPTDARYGLLYDDTTSPKHALAYVDLGATFDMTTGDLTISVNASGWFTETNA